MRLVCATVSRSYNRLIRAINNTFRRLFIALMLLLIICECFLFSVFRFFLLLFASPLALSLSDTGCSITPIKYANTNNFVIALCGATEFDIN